MACARPLLLAVNGEARDLIERQAGAALHVEPENPTALADAILRLHDDPAYARDLGLHGRAFVEAHFDRNTLAVALEARINTLLGLPAPAWVETTAPIESHGLVTAKRP